MHSALKLAANLLQFFNYTSNWSGIHRKKRKDYAFRRQFNEKPSIIPGCPGSGIHTLHFLSLGLNRGVNRQQLDEF